jgi:hypothetical protein
MFNGIKKNHILQESTPKSTTKTPEKKEEEKEKASRKSYIDKPIKEKNYRLEVYREDCKLIAIQERLSTDVQTSGLYKGRKKGGGKKTKIRELTPKVKRTIKFHMNNTKMEFKNMITLTYPKEFPSDGEKVKYHLKKFLQFMTRQKASYIWFIEFQERGAPHFHILTDTFIEKEKVSERWYKIVDSKDEKHLLAGTKCETIRKGREGMKSYMRKYVTKTEQKEVPVNYQNVGRFWGKSKEVLEKEVVEIDREEAINIKYLYQFKTEDYLKKMLKEKYEPFDWESQFHPNKTVILWKFKEEIREELMKIVQGERADARDNLSEETEPFTLNSKSNEKPS